MKLWIARDKDGVCALYRNKPVKCANNDHFWLRTCNEFYDIDGDLFPSVTWENSPQEVELKLI